MSVVVTPPLPVHELDRPDDASSEDAQSDSDESHGRRRAPEHDRDRPVILLS
ncbi:hypothetical protein KIN20_018031 [Parelaphostrongylus tenuis]|uniref:Uncharacterized protein n=1 Tax=Parelaphostrongylus tenuis TaxID=148309 RepID=A0AAD5QR79_PARTN|nr:hypothetical protein KIN20_018031 [Parelaphostrongylus tenuis]